MTAPPGELERFDVVVGRVLRTGVLVSSAFLALGLLAWFLAVDVAGPLLHAGLFCLMATPVVRLMASVVEYARTREWFFFWMTCAVMAVLVGTVWFAIGGSV
jgi:uncharacterized membrane protein